MPSQSAILLTVLMLRGPQTAGELRIACERMHNFADISSVEAFLDELAERPAGALVVEAAAPARRAREPLGAPARRRAGREHAGKPAPASAPHDASLGEVAALKANVARLEAEVAALKTLTARICSELGIANNES